MWWWSEDFGDYGDYEGYGGYEDYEDYEGYGDYFALLLKLVPDSIWRSGIASEIPHV